MRLLLIAASAALLAGCAHSPPLETMGGRCYIVVDKANPVAEVCDYGHKVNYRDVTKGDPLYDVPPYVKAVIQMHGYLKDPSKK